MIFTDANLVIQAMEPIITNYFIKEMKGGYYINGDVCYDNTSQYVYDVKIIELGKFFVKVNLVLGDDYVPLLKLGVIETYPFWNSRTKKIANLIRK